MPDGWDEQERAALRPALDPLVADLRETLGVSRVTVRLAAPDAYYPLTAESLGDGVRTMWNAEQPDTRGAGTYEALQRDRAVLLQDDTATAPVRPPRSTIEEFDVRAQMLGPLVRGERLLGIVSVHQGGGPRSWGDADVEQLERTVGRVLAALER